MRAIECRLARLMAGVLVFWALTDVVSAQVFNEIVVNPNGGDSNCEYIEIKGQPGGDMTDYWFASVEGDATSNEGTFDFVVSLGKASLGSNGLLVITAEDTTGPCGARDYGTPATTLIRDVSLNGGRLENGTNSYLLILTTATITESVDYDTDDDGILEALPGDASIVDSVGWADGGVSDVVYGLVNLPLTSGGTNDMATRFPGNNTANELAAWYHGDMDGSAASLSYDLTQISENFPVGGQLTPGGVNAPSEAIFSDRFED